MRYSLVIFDLDDTLIDYHAGERQAIFSACRALGISAPDAYEKYRVSNKLARMTFMDITHDNLNAFRSLRAEYFLESVGGTGVSVECFLHRYVAEMSNGIVFDDAKPCLEQLRGKCRLIVASNGDEKTRRGKLSSCGLLEYFDAVYTSESLACSKPDPNFFGKILKEQKCSCAEALAVGDSIQKDLICAQMAGIDCCIVQRGLGRCEECTGATYIVSSLAAVVKIMEGRI